MIYVIALVSLATGMVVAPPVSVEFYLNKIVEQSGGHANTIGHAVLDENIASQQCYKIMGTVAVDWNKTHAEQVRAECRKQDNTPHPEFSIPRPELSTPHPELRHRSHLFD
jgi:hypothetical protein